MIKELYEIQIKSLGNHKFLQHPHSKNYMILQIFFENGYGISVLTKKPKSNKLFEEISSIYDIAILKGTKTDNEVVILSEMQYVDPDYKNYEENDGVWKDLDYEKIYHKAMIVSLL